MDGASIPRAAKRSSLVKTEPAQSDDSDAGFVIDNRGLGRPFRI